MTLEELTGKVVAKIDRCDYRTSLTVHFTDNTILVLGAGSTGMHNDHWGTVEYTIKTLDQQKADSLQKEKEKEEKKKKEKEEKKKAKKKKTKGNQDAQS